jgi:hypothetical protein
MAVADGDKKRKRLPWQDQYGNLLPLGILKKNSQSWEPETWDAYLASLERPQVEKLGKTRDLGEVFEAVASGLAKAPRYSKPLEIAPVMHKYEEPEEPPRRLDPRLKWVRFAVRELLTRKEKPVINGHYWEGEELVDLARRMRVRYTTVHTLKTRAEHKLRAFLSKILPVVENRYSRLRPIFPRENFDPEMGRPKTLRAFMSLLIRRQPILLRPFRRSLVIRRYVPTLTKRELFAPESPALAG